MLPLITKKWIIYCLLFVIAPFCSAYAQRDYQRKSYALQLGDRTVHAVKHQFGQGIHFFSMHDAENTSVQAALSYVRKNGGTVLELVHNGERHVNFNWNDTYHEFDPNGMFTPHGVLIRLEQFDCYSPGAGYMVEDFGKKVLELYNPDSLQYIVTLHNNFNEGYSAWTYLQYGNRENDTQDMYYHPDNDPDDFVFVTNRFFYQYLKAHEINVVLQGRGAPDDGSLSIYAELKNIPYANIEAQHGHYREQLHMLQIVAEMIWYHRALPLIESKSPVLRNEFMAQ